MKFVIVFSLFSSITATSSGPSGKRDDVLQQHFDENPQGFSDAGTLQLGATKIGSRSVENFDDRDAATPAKCPSTDNAVVEPDISSKTNYDVSTVISSCQRKKLDHLVRFQTGISQIPDNEKSEFILHVYKLLSALAAIKSLECSHSIVNEGQEVKLSAQQIVDCIVPSKEPADKNKNLETHYWNYLERGSVSEEIYHNNTMMQGQCKYNGEKSVLLSAFVSSYKRLCLDPITNPALAVKTIKNALSHGPVFTTFNIHLKTTKSLLTLAKHSEDMCGDQEKRVDYPINIFGWGFDDATNKSYWIVVYSRLKNRASTQLVIGQTFVEMGVNCCGIEESVSYVVARNVKQNELRHKSPGCRRDPTTKNVIGHLDSNQQSKLLYALAVVRSLECSYSIAIKDRKRVKLSAQQIVDCFDPITKGSDDDKNKTLEAAQYWDYLKGGFVSELIYPFTTGRKEECKLKTNETTKMSAAISSHHSLSVQSDEKSIKVAFDKGSIFAIINIDPDILIPKKYSVGRVCGVMDKRIDLPINIVGSFTHSITKQKYWIVTFSRFTAADGSTTLLSMDQTTVIERGVNWCGIEDKLSYVVVEELLLPKYDLRYVEPGCVGDVKTYTNDLNNLRDYPANCMELYPFAAIASLECAHSIANDGQQVILSEAKLYTAELNLIHCEASYMESMQIYWNNIKVGMIQMVSERLESDSKLINVNVSEFHDFYIPHTNKTFTDENTLRIALRNYGILAALIGIDKSKFNEIKMEGIFTANYCGTLNYPINIIGWNEDERGKFWIVRNYMGTNWGNKGYTDVQRGVNRCSIESHVAYVVAEKVN